jgi:hypothetical protein
MIIFGIKHGFQSVGAGDLQENLEVAPLQQLEVQVLDMKILVMLP